MQYREEQRDLFTVPQDYAICHCISSDFALGMGIAKEFAKRGVKAALNKHYTVDNWFGEGYALLTYVTGYAAELSLVTKSKYWQKPTIETLKQALVDMRVTIEQYTEVTKVAMPQIGCGLDRLKWEEVKRVIQEVFRDSPIEILVCIYDK